jgi:hypothetical protein
MAKAFLSSLFVLAAFFTFILNPNAEAYPHYIGYGYQSCANCHYNPLGNGPLTDYGRALSATTIAARPFFASAKTTDDDLAAQSGFLGKLNIGDYIRPSLSYRGLELETGVDSPQSMWMYITMVMDANLVIKNQNGNLFISGTLGYLPTTATSKPTSNLTSREYYVGYRPWKKVGFYLGLMDVAYGIRVPDHTAFSRYKTLIAQNDQSDALMVHGSLGNWEGAVMGFVGNSTQTSDLRLKGASTTAEYTINQQMVAGPSLYYASNNYRKRMMGEVHTRLGGGNGSALLAEFGFIREKTVLADDNFGNYIFIQEMYSVVRGFNILMTGQYYTKNTFSPYERDLNIGPGFQYLPMQRVELRSDIAIAHSFGGAVVSDDNISFLTQLHLWF